jgi:hypothetical protein
MYARSPLKTPIISNNKKTCPAPELRKKRVQIPFIHPRLTPYFEGQVTGLQEKGGGARENLFSIYKINA